MLIMVIFFGSELFSGIIYLLWEKSVFRNATLKKPTFLIKILTENFNFIGRVIILTSSV